MKQLLSFGIVFVFAGITIISAQDVITLRDGRKIEAKVLEIATQTVRFQRMDNLTGPAYVYDVCDIDQITFSNGSTDRFAPCKANNNDGVALPANGATLNVNMSTTNRRSMTETPMPPDAILYTGLHTFYINNVHVSRQMVREVMRKNNPAAFHEFDNGFGSENIGTVMYILGGGCGVTGLGLALADYNRTLNEDPRFPNGQRDGGSIRGWSLAGAGLLMITLGAASHFTARKHYTRSVLKYNESLSLHPAPLQEKEAWSWAVGATPQGVGVTVRF